jgi:hypothetical protein
MNEKEAREHARDCKTVGKAVDDENHGKHERPHRGLADLLCILSDQDMHDNKVYSAAWKEAHKDR